MSNVDNVSQLIQELNNKGVKYCISAYVDIHGTPKGKVVPLEHLRNMNDGSERYTGYALDGLGQAPNDDEIVSIPDLNRMIEVPWDKKLVWFPSDNLFRGSPYELNTRVALKNQLAKAEKLGYGMNTGIECEVFLLEKSESGLLNLHDKNDKLKKPCYDINSFLGSFSWLDRMASSIQTLGWDLYSFDHEDANGQFEFDFKYSDALTTCDRFIFFRMMAKKYANDLGLFSTMMPKPFADKTGNGAHLNMSLYDLNTKNNIFQCDSNEDPQGIGMSTVGYNFIAGVLKHGKALCAVLAPTVNSYKRLVKRSSTNYFSWAPVFNSYGSNNRTNSIRIPSGGGRCESRNADGAMNPYLATALVLAAGLEGIEEKLDPGMANDDNLYEISDLERNERGIAFLPQTLKEAIEYFAEDPFVEKAIGKDLRDEFVKYKREEWEEYHRSISTWEIERYSDMF